MKCVLPADFLIEKYGIKARLVEISDADFILRLRSDKMRNKHVHEISVNVEDQIKWINDYKIRENVGQEYYFVICDFNMKPFGTTRLYNFAENSFDTGSWVFLTEAPVGMAILGDIVGREIAFDVLEFEICNFDVRKENKSVIANYHLKYNPTVVGEDELNYYFKLNKEQFNIKKRYFLKLLGHAIE
jgi:hypothetical protein